ncbi:MAG: trypsin-like peptidase domain-containing protein [Nannocystaceae bacterium]|nr:trypsin-like peptidase domain-containing protein [Nannocystaceae bacterium]
MNKLKRNASLLFLASVATAGCAEETSEPELLDALEQVSIDDDLKYVSANEPFDPEAVDEPTRAVSSSVVTVKSADGSPLPADVLEEVEDLSLRFGHALVVAKGAPYFAARSAEEERVEITYLGKGRVAPSDDDFETSFTANAAVQAEQSSYERPEKYRDDATWVTGFNPVTHSEFEVRIPKELASIVGADADARGANRETDSPWSPTEELLPRHQVGSQDTRVLKGAQNTAQTSTNLSRITTVGPCTGVLIGQNQVLTVAHCLYTSAGWRNSRQIAVGANGTGNLGSVTVGDGLNDNGNVTSTADGSIYWISSLFKDAIDNGGSTIAYDIGTVALPNDPLGAATGWFGYSPSNVSHDDMYNRGYPDCNAESPPPSCIPGHMFGDANNCGTGGFSSSTDASGYSLYGYHSCDANAGHSGSPLYRNSSSNGWVVRGVHVGLNRWGLTNDDLEDLSNSTAALSFTLITQGRKDLFDVYNAMYTSP